jgi:hypothetical protein
MALLGSLGWAPMAALAQTSTPTASSSSYQQTIELQEGWNLVSLRVSPETPDVEELLATYADEIVLVRDLTGAAFMAREELNQMGAWNTHQAYFVYAEIPVAWTINGELLSPNTTPIVLQQGWNLVPYLPETPQPTEEALNSIIDHLLIAEDGEGNVFVPELGITSLDSLRDGRGYKVYIEAPDTLVYGDAPNEPLVVNTLAEAKALTDMPVGSTIEVLGYHEPDDGGGGLFEVTDDACGTDGGTCFVFDEDVSEEQHVSLRTDFRSPVQFYEPDGASHANFVFGTVVLDVAASENGGPTTDLLTWEHHHGHSNGNRGAMVKHDKGEIGGRDLYLRGARGFVTGENAQQSIDWNVRYKYATSNRRLKRLGITDTVNLAWWGAPVADEQNPQNAGPYLNHAIERAVKIRDANSHDWVYVDISGHYYYRYSTSLPNKIMLRGTGEPNAEGYKGQLTIVPGLAMDHLKVGGATIRSEMNMQQVDFRAANIATGKIGARDIEFFGNIEGNEDAIYDPENIYGNVDDRMQNANQWNGLVGPSAAEVGSGNVELHLINVYMHDYPGNGIAAANRFDVTPSDNVRVGNAPSNHQAYHAGTGTYNNWSIEGSAWDTMLRFDNATFIDLEFKNLREGEFWSPFGKEWSALFDHEPRFIDSSDFLVDGFTIDMSGGNNRSARVFSSNFLFKNGPHHGTLRDGTILSLPGNGTTLYSPRGPSPSFEDGPIGGVTFENIVFTNGGGGIALFGGLPSSHVKFKNITLGGIDGVDYAGGIGTMQGFNLAHPMAARISIDGLLMEKESGGDTFVKVNYSSGNISYDLFVTNSQLLNRLSGGQTPIISGFGPLSDEERKEMARWARVYIANTSVLSENGENEIHRDLVNWNYFTSLDIKERPVKLRNVTDQDGRTSEDTGEFFSTASDEGNDYVLIPTNLISYAFETEVELTSGPSGLNITSVEVANSDGSLRSKTSPSGQWEPYLRVNLDGQIGTGETVTFDWTARVTPLSEFALTGLFIPRPIEDQTLAEPTTIDLRGVAASAESDEMIIYTASSSDESVVTATIQANDYMLDLSPQGSGTATITMTGEIPGVGTASDTFEVTVE